MPNPERDHQDHISIIIPVRNGREYLDEALDSVISQSYSDFEVLVINDGSTDGDYDAFAQRDKRIRVLHLPGVGVSAARNHGMARASGHLIAFLDADDVWFPGKLEAQVRHFDAHPNVGVVFGRFIRWPALPDGGFAPASTLTQDVAQLCKTEEDRSGWLYTRLLNGLLVGMNTAVVRRSVYEAIGGFNESMRQGEDYDFWLRASRIAQMHSLDGAVALYRIHPASAMHRLSPHNHLANLLKAASMRWGLAAQGGPSLSPKAFDERLGSVHFDHAYSHYWHGDRKVARGAFWQALKRRHRPLRSLAYIALSFWPAPAKT